MKAIEEYRRKLAHREKHDQFKKTEWNKACAEFEREVKDLKKEVEILRRENYELREQLNIETKRDVYQGPDNGSVKGLIEGINEKENEIRLLWNIIEETFNKDTKKLAELKNKVDLELIQNTARRIHDSN